VIVGSGGGSSRGRSPSKARRVSGSSGGGAIMVTEGLTKDYHLGPHTCTRFAA
jgi:hypothetical protein